MGKLKPLMLIFLLMSVLTPFSTAQNGTPLEHLQLSLGETRSFNIELRNPLAMNDNIELSFSGRAFRDGYVQINLSSEDIGGGGIREVESLEQCDDGQHCCNGDLECIIHMQPGEDKNIKYSATATLAGQVEQAELIVDAKSQVTQLTGSDKMTISTRPVDQGGPVSAPALTAPFVYILAFMASIFYMFYKS